MDWITSLFNGTFLALLGAALAMGCAGMGSAKGVGIAAEAATGVLAEDPNKFVLTLILQALPSTQGIYGFVVAFLIMNNIGLFAGEVYLTVPQGFFYLAAALPIAIAGYHSAVAQGRASAAAMQVVAKRPDQFVKGMLYSAMVETFAVLALLISIMMLINI